MRFIPGMSSNLERERDCLTIFSIIFFYFIIVVCTELQKVVLQFVNMENK